MKKHIVLSVNYNQDYMYFVPLAVSAWSKLGWWPVIFYTGARNELTEFVFDEIDGFVSDVDSISGYRSATVAQISRLYASCFLSAGDYIMTGDVDMLPLSDYWQPNPKTFTVWGHDLTGYGHYPICYLGATTEKWREVMRIDSTDYNALIKRDLDTLPQAKSDDFNKFWYCDQDLITQRLKPFNPTIINRGQYSNGYARGRVDRGAWSIDHKELIDCHMHHQIHHKGNEWKFDHTMELLRKVWPEENFDWFVEYTKEFKRLTGHA